MAERFTPAAYARIVQLKTSDYTFYLPLAGGMLLAGKADPVSLAAARTVCDAVGEYFQVQDDFLDFYGDEATTGKIGT
eukprot:SAG22_NODE_2141_length_2948_cov_1.249912_4_plen_78_part_00